MRRALAAVLAATAMAGACASAADRLPVVGLIVLSRTPAEELERRGQALQGAFAEAMRERGWVEGRNVRFAWRAAAMDEARGRAAVDELLGAPVDVLVAPSVLAGHAVERTKSVPVVGIEFGMDLIASMARPGGNLTGVMRMTSEAELIENRTKILALARDITGATRIARVVPGEPGEISPPLHPSTVEQARRIGVTLDTVGLVPPGEMDRAVREAKRRGVGALMVTNFPHWNDENSRAFAAAARRHGLPVVGEPIFNARLQDVIVATYGVDLRQIFARAAYFVDRILRGAKPGDLPVETLSALRLTLYPDNAKAFGIAIPGPVLVRADEIAR